MAAVYWFTGLSGSGKSTLADMLFEHLHKQGRKVERLDGDKVRELFPEIGFSRTERNAHIKRMGYLASVLEKNDITVVASFISPYAESRDFARSLCNNFVEIYVSTPLAECEKRDSKGLYAKARRGEIKNLTGVGDTYEPPVKPELTIDTSQLDMEQAFQRVVQRALLSK